jgi:chondroitin 4-sulfotransferase 11
MGKNLYIRLAKTGSSSVSDAINKDTDEVIPIINHYNLVSNSEYDYKFTFIRNPYDRIVSSYHNLVKNPKTINMRTTLRNKLDSETSFMDFLTFVNYHRDNIGESKLNKEKNIHLYPWYKDSTTTNVNIKDVYTFQLFWILNHTESLTDSIEFFMPINELDFIGKFESLNEDFKFIKSKLNLKKELPHLNKSNNRDRYGNYYNNETFDIVTRMYQKDLNNFNYKF